MPDCGVHYLWFAFVCFLIRSHPPSNPPPKIWLLGLERQGVIFFQKIRICVFEMISATRGSF